MRAAFHHAKQHSPGLFTFWFEPLEPFHFVAGQFTQLSLPHADADSRGMERWMTISSSPHEPLVGITTSFAAQNGSSFKRELQGLAPGQVVSLAAPIGDFVLPKSADIPLVFVGAGLGITPTASIVSWLTHADEQRDVTVLHAANPVVLSLFEQLFCDTLGVHYVPHSTHGADSKNMGGMVGGDQDLAVLAARLTAFAQAKPEALFYLAGPKKFVGSLADVLRSMGVPAFQIVTDLFPGYDS